MWNFFKSGEQIRLKASIILSGWNHILPIEILWCDGFWLLNTAVQRHSALVPFQGRHLKALEAWEDGVGLRSPTQDQSVQNCFSCIRRRSAEKQPWGFKNYSTKLQTKQNNHLKGYFGLLVCLFVCLPHGRKWNNRLSCQGSKLESSDFGEARHGELLSSIKRIFLLTLLIILWWLGRKWSQILLKNKVLCLWTVQIANSYLNCWKITVILKHIKKPCLLQSKNPHLMQILHISDFFVFSF